MRPSLLYKNSQILQQKLYILVELCENAMTLKYVILLDPGVPMLLTGIKYVGKAWFIYLHKNMSLFGEIFMSLRSSCCFLLFQRNVVLEDFVT